MKDVYAVLLAGGKGTRLWPLSTDRQSKSFVRIGNRRPLIEDAISRLGGFVARKNIIVVVDKLQEKLAKRSARGVPGANIIVEPFGRSTASAVGLAAIALPPEAVMVVLPTDALIGEAGKFRSAMREAAAFARDNDGVLLCAGTTPKRPTSAYGYIKLGKRKKGKIYSVDKFVEKPSESLAAIYIRKGNYLWNAGIFAFRAKTILDTIKAHAPHLYSALQKIKSRRASKKKMYSRMRNISIDYQIMEKAENLYCVKSDFSWQDLGSWKSAENLFKKDKNGNAFFGNVTLLNTRNCVVYNAGKRKLGVLGFKDAIIAHTENGTLICGKKDAEKVKELAGKL